MKYRRYHNGFTLIDLAIYSGLLGILLVILSEIFISIVQLQLSSSSQGVLEQNGAYLISRMTYDIRRAASITAPTLGESAATLSAVIADPSAVQYTYSVQNGNLMLTTGSTVRQLNSNDTRVSNLLVATIGNTTQSVVAKDTVQISFTIHSGASVSAGQKERTYQTVVSIR